MPIPQQVNDRIKEAPAVMLRAVFAGVGQLLLAADKVRARAAGTGWPYDRTTPKGGTAGPGLAERQARAQARWHTLDDNRAGKVPLARERTDAPYRSAQRPVPGSAAAGGPAPGGSGRVTASAAPAATAAAPARTASAAGKPVTLAEPAAPPTSAELAAAEPAATAESVASVEPATQPEPAAQAGPDADAPPLPGYDDLSLASLRGRLRVFDAATLRALLAYEKAHAHRDDVITLFERRLEKITAE